jgi:hypothetical protein
MIYRHYLNVTSDKNLRETITRMAKENSLKFVIKSSQADGQSQRASFFTLEGNTPLDIWKSVHGIKEHSAHPCLTVIDLGYDEDDTNFVLRGLGCNEFPSHNEIVYLSKGQSAPSLPGQESWAFIVCGVDGNSTILVWGGDDLKKEFDKGFSSPEDMLIAPPSVGTWLWRGKYVEISAGLDVETYTVPRGTITKIA